MKVKWIGQQETKAYYRSVEIEVEDITYNVNIHWDEHDGYETYWYEYGDERTVPKSIEDLAIKEQVSVGYLLELLADKENNK